ncbi:MAG: endonuclease, partial [Bacilli bacterium]|nr:endonuclease [Bacilli bacterium]
HGNRDGLMSEMKAVTKSGKSGSYDGLWTTYKNAYVRSDGYIYDYYSNITNYVPGDDQDHGSHPQENYSYNREHSIPKSWWGGDYSTGTQGCDPFIVVPTDAKINEIRSSYAFGYVSSVTERSANNYSLLGYADETWGYSGKVFEPNDQVKGDFARIYFYALTKYDVSSWDSGDGSEFFSGNLSKYFGLTDYAIKLLSYWSNLDPVSDWERSVNNKIEPIQNNRNPFIDHPEYANVLWGNHSSYTIYNH